MTQPDTGMQTLQIDITNPTGLHTRPGTEFVRLAKTFSCEITVRKGDRTANAKSLVKLLRIGISRGDSIVLDCRGEDETEAAAQLERFIRQLKD